MLLERDILAPVHDRVEIEVEVAGPIGDQVGPEHRATEGRQEGDPEKIKTYDLIDPELGKVTPYGICDLGRNRGWVSVGIDRDTAVFALAAPRSRWDNEGSAAYSTASLAGVHRIASLAKRWLLGTHKGSVDNGCSSPGVTFRRRRG